MFKRWIIALCLSAATAGGAVAQSRESSVVGVVTKVDPGRIEVRTDRQESTSVTLSPETRYLKWITAKPWQQDPRTTARLLHVGSRVHIELVRDTSQVARTVWIVVGRPGF